MASVVDRHFDYLRKQREADINKRQQASGESFERQAAKQGMQGSGAIMKLRSQQEQDFGAERSNAIDDVEGQRAMALSQIEEAEKNRAFAREERIGSQKFASEEAKAGREFQTSERVASQGFNKEIFDKEMSFKKRVQLEQELFNGAQMKMAMKQFKLDERVSEFNMDMATKQWNKKDVMEFFANMHGYDPRSGGFSSGNNPLVGSSTGSSTGYGSGSPLPF